MDINLLYDKLLDFYKVSSAIELAQKMQVSQQAISGWRSRNSVSAIKKKCRELGIYNEIFGDINTQTVHNNHGQIAQNMSGNQVFTSGAAAAQEMTEKDDDIDPATYNLFLEAYQKAVKNDDLKNLRMILMDY